MQNLKMNFSKHWTSILVLVLVVVISALTFGTLAEETQTEESQIVAQIGDVQYTSLEEAIDASDATESGATITLLADATLGNNTAITKPITFTADGEKSIILTSDITIGAKISVLSGEIVINGDNHTISRNKIDDTWYTGNFFTVSADAVLTLAGGTTIDGGNNWTFREENFLADIKTGSSYHPYATAQTGAPVAIEQMFVVSGTVNINHTTIQNSWSSSNLFIVNNGGKLIFNQGSLITHNYRAANGLIASVANIANLIINDGAVIKGNYSSAENGALFTVAGTMVINGGEICSNYGRSSGMIMLHLKSTTAAVRPNLTMNGGIMCHNHASPSGWGGVIYAHGEGNGSVFTMNGGTIEANDSYLNTGVVGNGELSEFNLLGGTIDCPASYRSGYPDIIHYGDMTVGKEMTVTGDYLWFGGADTIIRNDGTINFNTIQFSPDKSIDDTVSGTGTWTFDVLQIPKADIVVTITEGTFLGDLDIADPSRLVITGGTYSDLEAVKFLADGLGLIKNTDGTYTVTDQIAEVNGVVYNSLAAAEAAANDGDTIKLLTIIPVKESISVDHNVIIDLNYNEIYATVADVYPIINALADVLVQGEGIVDGKTFGTGYTFGVGNSETTGTLTVKSGSHYGTATVAYVTNGTLNVQGGYFEATPYIDAEGVEQDYRYTLHCDEENYVNGNAMINVTGGTYYGFDPKNNLSQGEGTDFSSDQYKSRNNVEDNTWTVADRQVLTVTFEGLGSVSVVEDDLVAEPAEKPTKLNHIFEGWDYDFSQPITENIEIKAIWTEAAALIENEGITTYYRTLQEAVDAAEALAALGDGTETQTVVLLKNITLNKMITIDSGNITIEGNGFEIIRSSDNPETTNVNEAYAGTFFTVKAGASLTLGGGLIIDGGNKWTYNKENGEYVLKTVVDNYTSTRVGYAVADFITYQADAPVATQSIFSVGGYLTVNDVTVQNNAGSSIFSVLNGGKLITNEDALFTHNASKTSGTVANVPTGAEFVMNGSTIRETVGGNHGGCILVSGGKFTMNGGLAEHNFTIYHASFLRLTGGQFVMNDGTIRNNASLPPRNVGGNQVGSAIDVTYGATAEFNGGTVCNNYGYLVGGVNHVGGKIDINGGTFVDNTAWAAFDSDSLLSDVSFGKPGATVKGGTFGTEIYQACVLDANIDTIIPAGYEQFVIGTDENGNPNLWEVVPGWNATFVDDKGNILQTGPVRIGDTPVFSGELPAIENEDDCLWVWDKEIVPVTDSDVTYTGSWKLAVAAVIKKDNPNDPNPERYYDLQMAIDAAEDGDTVVLLADIELNKKYTVAGKSITLDGDGHTITRGKIANGTWYVGNLFTVNAGAGLTLDGDLIIDGGNEWVLDETSYYEALRQANSTHYGAYAFVTAEEGAPVANARMFIVSGNLVINNVTIQNHMGGGVAHLNAANASMTLNDGALVKHCAHNNNGTLALMVAGTNLTINDGAKVTDNYFGYNGGMINAKSAVVTMNGGEISYSRGANSNGSVLMLINTDAAFYMNGGLICNNSSLVGESNGRNSAIQLRNNTMIMTGGTICNNEGYQFGGIDTNNSNSTLIISGGSVRDNLNYKEVDNWPKEDRDDIGGSVATNPSVSNNPNYSFTGGIFSQNVNYWTAKGYEGFDYYAFVIEENEDGTPYLWEVAKGWNVTFQDEKGNVLQSGPVRVGDTPVFSGELPEIENENDYLWIWDKPIVPVTDSDVVYTGGWKLAVAEVIKKDNPDDPNPMRFHELQLAIDAAEDGDTVRLLVDIPLTSKVTVAGKSITLDGDGYTITRGKDANGTWYTGNLFTINADASLKADGNLTIDGANNWTFKEENGEKTYLYIAKNYVETNLYSDRLQFVTAEAEGAFASADMFVISGSLEINNVTIKNHLSNASSYRSIFKVKTNAHLTMNAGAVITHNATAHRATVVRLDTDSYFTMNGGEISWNVGYWHGGCIENNAGFMVMNGGDIHNNHSTYGMGSVLFIYDTRAHANIPYPNFIMNGGEIYENVNMPGSGGRNGSVIYARNGKMEMHGGSIHENIGRRNGGICVNALALKITGGYIVNNIDMSGLYYDHDIYADSTTSIYGGVFTQDVNRWCAETYIAVPQDKDFIKVLDGYTAWLVDKTSIESISQEKEIFGTVTDSENTNINNDSAYSVEINVNHFYNKCYLSPEIHFSQNLPVNTTIILRDIDKDAPGYWYYKVETETNSIPLSEFVRMGSTETFSTPMVKPAFRFVIDFSKTENGMPSDSLETSLKLIPATTLPADNENYYKSGAVYWVPESEAENFEGTVAISPVENILLAYKKFTLETDTNGGLMSTIDYNITINAEASKWDYREFALIINISEAPTDAVLSALVNGSERTIIPYIPGNYIIPLGSVFKGQVIITLESNMFPINGKEYTATCSLYASESVADASPLNGEILAQKTEGLFTKTDDYASIKITGPLIDAVEKHVFDNLEDVNVTIDKIIPNNYTIKVQLEQKDSDGNYVKVDTIADQEGDTYTFDLDDCEPDSYRIVAFAVRVSDGFVSARDIYYFVV